METHETIRKKIDELICSSVSWNYKKISEALNQNAAYIQQFIKKGSPVVLPDQHRRFIAKIFNIDESDLMTDDQKRNEQKIAIISKNSVTSPDSVSIEVIDARACCGSGVENTEENVIGFWHLPREEFQTISFANPDFIKMLRVYGDSMEPTLKNGDWVLVDISQNFIDSDGLFLLRMSSGLAVKRIQNTISKEVVIKSDNPKYDNISAAVSEIQIVGKVIYTLKAEKVG